MRALAVLVAIFALAHAQVPHPGSGRDCWFRSHHSRNVYDLRALHRYHNAPDYDAVSAEYDYKLAVCGASATAGECQAHGYGMCQYKKDETKAFVASLGFWSGLQPRWEELPGGMGRPHGVQVTFTNGDKCETGQQRRTVVRFVCSHEHRHHFTVVKEDPADCDWEFEMQTHHACPHHVPELPHVPKDYRAALEITNAQLNESYWLHEIWEETNQRLRWDQYFHPGGMATTIIQFDKHMRYSILNGTKCNAHALSPTMLMWPSVFDLFTEHRHQLEYAGVHMQRGIPCDVYEGKWTWHHPHDGHVYEEEALWWFARPNMHVVENPSLRRRPVFAAFRSNRTHPSLTSPDFHFYTFMDLVTHLGHNYDRELELHWRYNCPGGPAAPDHEETYDKMASGAVTALSFFMLALGGFFGLVAHWYYLKRRPTLGIQSSGGMSASADTGDISSYHS